MRGDDRVALAGAYLRLLLLRPGEYRAAWQRRSAGSAGPEEIDYAAVARLLVRPGGHPDAERPISAEAAEAVRRALEGDALDPTTLDRFVDAFGLHRRQAEHLHALLRGSDAVRVITGDLHPPAGLSEAGGPPGSESLSLHELHRLGPDGLPADHQTIQVIRSKVDGLTSVPYRFDTDELAVEVVRGGRVGDRVYRLTDTIHAVDILLDRPLDTGETAFLQVRTTFFYRSPPPPEFRRGVLGTADDVTMWVSFHRDRLPKRVWRARWDGVVQARIIDRELVGLDDELSVHSRFGTVERAVVGFTWEWD